MIQVGFYQFCPVFGEVGENLSKIVSALRAAEADIIVLPELALTGYYFQNRDELKSLAEDPIDSATVASLVALCRERDFFLVAGFAEKKKDKVFNSALLLGPSGLVHTYRKLHLFNTEKLYFDQGDTPLEVNKVRDIKIGMMLCYDYAVPEVARVLALQGADLLCNPANLVLSYCQKIMLARCFENSVFAVTANRYGEEMRPHGALKFTGQSQLVGPRGDLIYQAGSASEDLFISEIDPGLARDKAVTERNDVLGDRRPEFYQELLK